MSEAPSIRRVPLSRGRAPRIGIARSGRAVPDEPRGVALALAANRMRTQMNRSEGASPVRLLVATEPVEPRGENDCAAASSIDD